MTTLFAIHEPKTCPICVENERIGFLKKIIDIDIKDAIVNGPLIEYECQTCYALFGIEDEL